MFNLIRSLLEWFGVVSTGFDVVSLGIELVLEAVAVIMCTKVFSRLGHSLLSRKIHIVSSSDGYDKLKKVILDTGLFLSRNIKHIGLDDVDSADKATLILVDYSSTGNAKLKRVLDKISSSTGIIVYCDPGKGKKLDKDMMARFSEAPHAILNNFRGRLANDILTTLMALSYDKHKR